MHQLLNYNTPMHIVLATNWKKGNTGDFIFHSIKRSENTLLLISPLDCPYEESRVVAPDVNVVEFIDSLEKKPDIFLHVDCSAETWFFPKGIEHLEIPTAFWSTDSHFNFRWHKEWAGLFDYSFFTQLDWLNLAKKAGVDNATWLPYAADEVYHRDFNLTRDIDVGYVGSLNSVKKEYFKMLEDKGISVATNDKHFYYEDIGRFYSRCKIVYNIAARYDINQRIFEAPAAGALLVSQARVDGGFYGIFKPGLDADVHDFDDAASIIKGYLDNPEKLSRVAEAGQKLVLENHTYTHRIEKIIETCAKGINPKRKDANLAYLRHIKSAFTYQHPTFHLWRKATAELTAALSLSTIRTVAYMFRYLYFRAYEKAVKMRQKLGKAPY